MIMGANAKPTPTHRPLVARAILFAAMMLVLPFVAIALMKTVLAMLDTTVVAFAATPGGLIVLVFVWHWLDRPDGRDHQPGNREGWRG